MRACAAAVLLVAGCSSSGGSGSGERPLAVLADPFREVTVGAAIALDGTDSYDPDNAAPAFPHGIASYSWSLVVPSNSTATLSTGADGLASFTADVAGAFGGELVVVDVDGRESEPAPFGISSFPIDPEAAGLFVRLTWGANGSDLDLHLVQSGGTLAQPPLDCFYANINPDWGAAGNESDPLLSGDTTSGPGPEVIRVREPQQTSYTAYAHMFSDDGLGAQDAIIEIAHDGAPVASHQRTLTSTGLVWEVGTVVYASSNAAPTFTFTDATFQHP